MTLFNYLLNCYDYGVSVLRVAMSVAIDGTLSKKDNIGIGVKTGSNAVLFTTNS
jgi:hypothetical protein